MVFEPVVVVGGGVVDLVAKATATKMVVVEILDDEALEVQK